MSGGVSLKAEPADSRFHEHSILGIGAGIVSVVLVGFVCDVVGAPYVVQYAATAGAIGLPAAIEYSVKARRRNKAADESALRQGELRRPTGLVVAMFAAALVVLFLIDTIIGRTFVVALTEGNGISRNAAIAMAIVGAAIVGVCGFFASSYASHYLGNKPYLWTAVTVGVVFVLRALLALVEYRITPAGGRAILAEYGVMPALLIRLFVANGIYLGACLAGTWYGRRHHDEFLAKKLARAQREAARRGSQAPGLDLLEMLAKLGELRAAGVLTEEEFQAKKTEILARI